MHFYSITVVIICKFFEVVKSNIIILMADCNNYLHTLSKKKKFFWIWSFLAKIKGGGQVTKCPKKAKFWANRNFWPMGWPEGPKIGRVTISAILYPHLEGILISIKNKKVMLIESYVMPKNQKSWLPPPFGTQCPNDRPVGPKLLGFGVWDVRYFTDSS